MTHLLSENLGGELSNCLKARSFQSPTGFRLGAQPCITLSLNTASWRALKTYQCQSNCVQILRWNQTSRIWKAPY